MSTCSDTPSDSKGRLLIADTNEANVSWLIDNLLDSFSIHRETSGARLSATLETLAPEVVIVGEALQDGPGSAVFPALRTRASMFLSVSRDTEVDIDSSRHLHRGMGKEELHSRINAVLVEPEQSSDSPAPSSSSNMSAGEAAGILRLLEVAREFGAQSDLAGASRVLVRTLIEFLQADRADCLFYSARDASLWTEADRHQWSVNREVSAGTGLAGHVAQTSATIRSDRASAHSSYEKNTDDPLGKGNERILVHPLVDSEKNVHAILIAVRLPNREAFTQHDENICHWLTEQLAPLTAQLAMQLEVAEVLQEAQEDTIFRREAAVAHAALGEKGDVVRVSPPWIGWSYWALVAVLVASAVFLAVARIPDYSSGPVVVSELGRTEVLAPVSGNIETIDVLPGQEIVAGHRLATFYSPEESTELTRLDLEWQASLRAYLANRSDLAARSAVSSLRLRRNQLLDKLTLRAPHGGVVQDVRTASNRHIELGERLLSISQPGGQFSVIGFLPGADRPRLEPGMELRMTLEGYPRNYVDLPIESISSEVMGPREASQALGRGLQDSLRLPASVVVIRASLKHRSFEVDGQSYKYSHGMLGLGEVKLRSEPAYRTLVPSLGKR
ncbi:MAG: HlyD family efflux transporter periplasmic adaptor subunit [Myxococcales bacterium]|nr:HlyD family efflux transporter periplasmic adaptor subunit [Myxococcales bacterium]